MDRLELLCVDADPERRSETLLAVADAVRHADAVAVGDPETALDYLHDGTVGIVTASEFPDSDLAGSDLLARAREQIDAVACVLLSDADEEPDLSSVSGRAVEVVTTDGTAVRESLLAALGAAQRREVPVPPTEEERLADLRSYPVDDDRLASALDRLVTLAKGYFDTLFVNVHVLERDEQQSLACRGPDPLDARRVDSVCTYVILAEDVTVIEDLADDDRFADREYVSEFGLGGYAGAPIRSATGHALGTFCLLDDAPLSLSGEQREALELYAAEAADQFEYHRLRARSRTVHTAESPQ